MTNCYDCQHCGTVNHPEYKYHLLTKCELKEIIFQNEYERPINCKEFIEDTRIVSASNYLINKYDFEDIANPDGTYRQAQYLINDR